MNTVLTTLGAVALALSAGAASAQQTLLPARSEIAFTSHQMGVPVDGRFSRWTGQLSFDPKKPAAGQVSFAIDTGSASFGAPETDAEVPKPTWFNVAKFPQARFQSTGMKALGGGRYEVDGQLTIKGTARAVQVPVLLTQAAGVTTASGSFTIKRLDFKIGEGEWADTSMVANDVQVRFKLAVTGVAPL